MRKILTPLLFTLIAGCTGPSAEEKEYVAKNCQKFIEENMKTRGSLETRVFDIYSKRGALVAEVGYRKKYSDEAYSVRLCVVDKEKGTISSPSPLNDSEWKK